MNIYDLAIKKVKKGDDVLEKTEKILVEIYKTRELEVERWLSVLIIKLSEIDGDLKPESIINGILSSLSDESIHYPFTLLHDSQGTRIAGDLPPHIELKIKSKDNE